MENDVYLEYRWNVFYATQSSFCMKTVVFAWLAERNRGLMLAVGGRKNLTIKNLSWEGHSEKIVFVKSTEYIFIFYTEW